MDAEIWIKDDICLEHKVWYKEYFGVNENDENGIFICINLN